MWNDRYPIEDCPTRIGITIQKTTCNTGIKNQEFRKILGERKKYSLYKIRTEFTLTKFEAANAYNFATGKWYSGFISMDQDEYEQVRQYVINNREALLPRKSK